jgi:hypothetical protein
VEIVGDPQKLIIPMSSGGEKFALDDYVLVIGMHDATARILLNNINTPLVRSKYVLAVEKQD